ncbi:hypothetical protein SOCE26_097270 [Sorangium cellulosum]|uniref:Uncharacterized protein n=2 Tax=Sorangium cellulosum TaxID=56 RepID=A0A2L0F9D1_SORCE|nr:hypothetical protein SOCE26_097270 [Sorangium cellulosum]
MMLVFLALAAGCGAPAERDAAEQTGVESQALECDRECIRAMVNRHLALMGEFGNEAAYEASLRELTALGPEVVRVVVEVYDAWSLSAPPDRTESARPGEMRWRAAHLLGSLRQREGIGPLEEIATTPLPEPVEDEHVFADEYRVRLRAIAGLEKLGAAAELRAIYAHGGLLRTPAAASLYALGIDVGGIRFVDARTALAEDVADATDHNPNAGRPAQPEKPGSRAFRVTPRTDTPATIR